MLWSQCIPTNEGQVVFFSKYGFHYSVFEMHRVCKCPEKTYTRDLGEGVRKRHYHRTEKGKVVDFVVQLEVEIEGEWKPVIRYDCRS